MVVPTWIPEGRSEEQEIGLSGNMRKLEAYPWKWFTVEVFNEGPDTLYATANGSPDYAAAKLEERESKTFGTDRKPTVTEVKVWVLTGKTATAKISTLR